ncbi:MAG: thioredoxin family protein [Pseudomonadota bacterium]
MALMKPPVCDFGTPAPEFTLPATDGKTYTRDDVAGPNGMLIIFMCNHCPYVKAIFDRLTRDARDLQALGIGVAGISANDAESYPDDSFDNMARVAIEQTFTFPYLYDESQAVARAYGAACTPDFFGYNADLKLQYRGRLDASGARPAAPDTRRDLFEAMKEVATTGQGPADQIPSMGCSIKWKH